LRLPNRFATVPLAMLSQGVELVDTDAYASGDGGLADHRFYADGEAFDVERDRWW
jgi:hypothetical protein